MFFEINLSKIHTCGDFFNIMHNDIVDNLYIPIDKRIILIEEIDCMTDIILDRESTDSKTSIENTLNEMNHDEFIKFNFLKE